MAEENKIEREERAAQQAVGYVRGYRAAFSDVFLYLFLGLMCAGLIAHAFRGEK